MAPKLKRILLKLSGEALSGSARFGIDQELVERYAREIKEVHELGAKWRWWWAVATSGGDACLALIVPPPTTWA